MLKKIISILFAAFLVFAPVAAVAPTPVAAATLSGFHFGGSRGGSMFGGGRSSYHSYSSGPSHSYGTPFGGSRSYGYAPRPGIGSHLFSFGTGFLLGGLFHPFGGYYGMGGIYGYHPFSFFHFIIDLILIIVVVQIVRRMFFR